MGERLTFSYKNFKLDEKAGPDCKRFNEILANMDMDYIDDFTYPYMLRMNETRKMLGKDGVPSMGHTAEFALYRVWDKNVDARERVDDDTICTRTLKTGITVSGNRFMPAGTRVSYVIVPKIDKDTEAEHPCEYDKKRNDLFENAMDPKVYVLTRGYQGKIKTFGQYYINQFEKEFRENYKVLINEHADECMAFLSESHRMIMLGACLVNFGLEKGGVPNRTNIPPKDIIAYDMGQNMISDFAEISGDPYEDDMTGVITPADLGLDPERIPSDAEPNQSEENASSAEFLKGFFRKKELGANGDKSDIHGQTAQSSENDATLEE